MENQINNGVNNYIMARPYVRGKFLFVNNEKFYVKGVTYGTFEPDDTGSQFPESAVVEKDLTMMLLNGVNCMRTYTVPPKYLLDLAQSLNIKVMVGLPWEQHITFMDKPGNRLSIISRVSKDVINCKQHPAILCYTIGNEIPANIVRWYGKERIERFLRQLYNEVKKADQGSLVTDRKSVV